jgi:hemolysin activation/secretion protein
MNGTMLPRGWRFFVYCLAFAALFPLCAAARAQSLPGGQPLPGERDLLRERQRRLLDEQNRRLDELRQLPGPPSREPAESAAPAPEERCFMVRRISVKGARLIPEKQQREIVRPFEGRCLGSPQLNELLKRIAGFYLDRGYVTSRAYLPEQDLSGESLEILVVEGTLEGMDNGGTGPSHREIFMTFPGRIGERLDLRELEQMVDQLGRLPSRQAQIDIVPGKAPGASRVQVKGEPAKAWRASLRRDNSGERSVGAQQWGLSLAWDSPLGLADQLHLSGSRDADTRPWRRSNSQGVYYSLPIGWWTLSYSYNQSYYQARNEAPGMGFRFDTDGGSRVHQWRAERVLFRDAVSKTGASLGLVHLRTRNYFEDELIEVSSQRLSEFQLGFNHGRRIGGAFVNLDLGWQRGIGALDAQGRGHPRGAAPDSHYNKYSLTLSYLQPFVLGGESFSLESLANGQKSEDALFAAQRISLGGLASVRGFKDQMYTGNSGGYWRNQLRWRRAVGWPPLRPYVGDYSVAIAYDVGAIANNKRQGDQYGRLVGGALELTAQGRYLAASVTFARSLERPDSLERDEYPVYFSVNLTY